PILCKLLLFYTASTWVVNVFCEGGCPMSAANKAVVRRYFEEVVNKGNLAAADELFSTHYVSHYPTGYDFGGGPEDVKQITTVVRIAFPSSSLMVIAANPRDRRRSPPEGTDRLPRFFVHVYRLVAQVPKGKVVTYGQVAALLGAPRAARAVGTALRYLPGSLTRTVP